MTWQIVIRIHIYSSQDINMKILVHQIKFINDMKMVYKITEFLRICYFRIEIPKTKEKKNIFDPSLTK